MDEKIRTAVPVAANDPVYATTRRWLLFGRNENDESYGVPECDYWWPLWVEEPHGADSAEEMITLTWDRLRLGGEDGWREIAVVEADSWTTGRAEVSS